jgi:hypothetical protein
MAPVNMMEDGPNLQINIQAIKTIILQLSLAVSGSNNSLSKHYIF